MPPAHSYSVGIAFVSISPHRRRSNSRRDPSLPRHVCHLIHTFARSRRRPAATIVLRNLNVCYGEGSYSPRPAGVGRSRSESAMPSGPSRTGGAVTAFPSTSWRPRCITGAEASVSVPCRGAPFCRPWVPQEHQETPVLTLGVLDQDRRGRSASWSGDPSGPAPG